jgi:hypothetical protein
MYWWDFAASMLAREGTALRRFGFITTNSITQKFSRRILEKDVKSDNPISLIFAIPDHPWQKAQKKAAVRISMTVCEKGRRDGRLLEVTDERDLDSGQPMVLMKEYQGLINTDLTVGTDLTTLQELNAVKGISGRGVQLMGDGFILTPQQASQLGFAPDNNLSEVVKPYLHNRDIKSRPRGVMVTDLYDLPEGEVRRRFPTLYQWVLERVKPVREANARPTYKEKWWIFGEPRAFLRPAIQGLRRIIITGET